MTDTAASPRVEPSQPAAASAATGRRVRGLILAACAAVLVVAYVLTTRAVDAFGLHADLGIQYFLAGATADGAVPLIDFEHGWNTASWYLSAGLWEIADGNATGWVFLWGRGGLLIGAAGALLIAWRRALPPGWIAGLTAVTLALTHIPHIKYATAIAWVAVLLPAWGAGRGTRRTLRVGMAATVWWFHVELAVLLAIGTAMYDLFAEPDEPLASRVATAMHAPLGIVIGAGAQLAVYGVLGLGAGEVLSQLVFDSSIDRFDRLFNYPLGAPQTLRVALFPATVLLPFAPLVWRRLSADTRLFAMCHLALALIPIRRPGDGHVAAAGTLMALLVVFAALDLTGRRDDLMAAVRTARPVNLWTMVAGLGGAAWFAAGVWAGFRVESLVAIVALAMVGLAGVAVAARHEAAAASVGASVAASALVLGGAIGALGTTIGQDDALGETTAIAEAVEPAVDECVGADRRAWVVTSPLPLYDALALTNPTRIYAFWYNLEAQVPELREAMRAGEIPAIVQVTPWPDSLAELVPDIEAAYEACAVVPVPEVNRQVTVWRHAAS